jgi:antitoxin VapB
MEETMTIAKVFMNGRSQAIRLPKEFRVEGSEVYLKKESGRIVIEPMEKIPWAEFFKTFKPCPDFDVNRSALNDKPREVKF